MMTFAKIAGGAPSGSKAMRLHLMNETLSATKAQKNLVALAPNAGHLAAYYSTGIVHESHEIYEQRRADENEAHFYDWLDGLVAPDIVRLAEYSMTPDAEMTPGDIELKLINDIDNAIS